MTAAADPERKAPLWRRVLTGAFWFFITIPLTVAGYGLWLWFGLPTYQGQIEVKGLKAALEIMRDVNAVPHIFAEDEADAAYALGYTHAQDRLFQMDLMRRAGAGRLSEILGDATLETDKFTRTLGFYRAATESVAALSPETRAVYEAYAAGVNAYLQKRSEPLPMEFHLLAYTPEPWTIADSLVWGHLMAIQLSGNFREEILRARLLPILGAERLQKLFPDYPWEAPVTMDTAGAQLLAKLAEKLPALITAPRGASNEFVVDGRFTATGKPILANDPHLALELPGLWYLARLSTPKQTKIGATVPGVPLVVLGQNDRIAWGFTTTGADVQDVFLETLDPKNPNQYLRGESAVPFKVREEVIHVRGGADVTLKVRETDRGPVISDLLDKAEQDAKGRVATLAFTGLSTSNTTPEAIYRASEAKDWSSFQEALKGWVSPPQNVVYADADGTVAFMTPGYIPVRQGGEGFLPADGKSGEGNWLGPIPFNLLPQALKPRQGLFYNANNPVVGLGYGYFITREWEDHYRAERLRQLLAALPQRPMARGQDDVVMSGIVGASLAPAAGAEPALSEPAPPESLPSEDLQSEAVPTEATTQEPPEAKDPPPAYLTTEGAFAIMGDVVSQAAVEMKPLLLAHLPEDLPEDVRAMVKALRLWDGKADRHRPEPLLFNAWMLSLHRTLLADKLGDAYNDFLKEGPNVRLLRRILTVDREWCDDAKTKDQTENCKTQVTAAFLDAIAQLRSRYGQDFTKWEWGAAHVAPFAHPLLSKIPGLAEIFSHAIAADGDFYTLNRGAGDVADADNPFLLTHGAGYRAAYDLADRQDSRFMIATGQSGNPLSPYYGNWAKLWRDNQAIAISARGRDDLRFENIGITTLIPAPLSR